MRWHRESPSRPHSQGITTHSPEVCDDLPRNAPLPHPRGRTARASRPRSRPRRLAAPPPGAQTGGLPGGTRPLRTRPSRAHPPRSHAAVPALGGEDGRPRRAPRHRPPSRPIHLTGRGVGLHLGPSRRDGGGTRSTRVDDPRRRGAGGSGVRPPRRGTAAGPRAHRRDALRRGPGTPRRAHRRRPVRRVGPLPRPRTMAVRVGAAGGLRQIPVRHRVPDGQAPLLHPSRAGTPAVLQRLRPLVPRAGADHVRPGARRRGS